MTENAYSTTDADARRLWNVNQLVALDRHDILDELTGDRRPAAHRRSTLTARRIARLRRAR